MNPSAQSMLNLKRWLFNLAFVVARVSWLLLALLVLCLLSGFSLYFWHVNTTTTCFEANCVPVLNWFVRTGFPMQIYAAIYGTAFLLPALIWVMLGAWLFFAQPKQLWSFVFSLFFLLGWYSEISVQYVRGTLPAALHFNLELLGLNVSSDLFASFLRAVLKLLADGLLMLMIFAFPNGKLFPAWSRYYLLVLFVFSLGYALPFLRETQWNYLHWVFPLNYLINFGFLFGAILGWRQRYQTGNDLVAYQVRDVFLIMILNAFVYATDVLVGIFVAKGFFSSPNLAVVRLWVQVTINFVNGVAMTWLAIAIAQIIINQQLFDIRFVLNRALAYSALILSTGVLYGLIVGGLGTLFRQSNFWFSVLATGIIAVLFHPMLIGFRQAANRLFYGERNDPYRAISKLGQQLENALKPDDLAQTIVHTVASTLRLPFVALQMHSFSNITYMVAVGEPIAQPLEFLLLAKGRNVGSLVVSNRFAGESFSPSEMKLLEDLAARAAAAVQEALLNQELQASKEAIVLAREEERKRIRRDLHDGLGPMLASLSFQLQATRSLVVTDPTRADTLLESSASNVQDAITDIRRLVYGLRPPALDDLGLEGALRQQVGQMLGVYTDTQIDRLELLPAAVEVAAYRIACEALNNVSKHANAKHVKLSLRLEDGGLTLSIQDDGIGLKKAQANGVGMHSMRERTLELGGKLEIESEQGTQITAWLPLRK